MFTQKPPEWILILMDHSFLGKGTNFRAKPGKVQDESDTSICVRKEGSAQEWWWHVKSA